MAMAVSADMMGMEMVPSREGSTSMTDCTIFST